MGEAVNWFRKAAEQGHAAGQFNLAGCCYRGDGIAQDYTEAAKWYRKAAEQGKVEAQYNLGGCCYRGKGVSKDQAEGLKWLGKAADKGNVDAQNFLHKLAVIRRIMFWSLAILAGVIVVLAVRKWKGRGSSSIAS